MPMSDYCSAVDLLSFPSALLASKLSSYCSELALMFTLQRLHTDYYVDLAMAWLGPAAWCTFAISHYRPESCLLHCLSVPVLVASPRPSRSAAVQQFQPSTEHRLSMARAQRCLVHGRPGARKDSEQAGTTELLRRARIL
jgi:hypothetical protein